MSSTAVLLAVFAISLYGLLKLIRKQRKYGSRHAFGIEYLENLRKYWESGGRDLEAYGWLIHRSNKMQNDMGGYGVMHGYKPPFQNYIIKNYDVILNVVPELRKCFDNGISHNMAHQFMSLLQEAIVRYLGSIEDSQHYIAKDIRNPIKWFRDGVRDIIALPAYLFGWLGVISESTAKRFVASLLFTAISGVVALVGFVGAIVTIAIGWDEFLQIVNNIWP